MWRRLWLAPASAAGVLAMAVLPGTWVAHLAVVRPDQPWFVALARLPLSVFATAPPLPWWGALAQLTVVTGLAQYLLGTPRTLALSGAANALATAAGRLFIAAGGWLGLPGRFLHEADVGPSVVVLALLAYLGLRHRKWWLLAGLLVYEVGESLILPGLDQREHIVALVIGALAALPQPPFAAFARGWSAAFLSIVDFPAPATGYRAGAPARGRIGP